MGLFNIASWEWYQLVSDSKEIEFEPLKSSILFTQPPAWENKAEIEPNEIDSGLGWSIDVSGDTLIAGSWKVRQYCYNETSNEWMVENQLQGSVSVFIRTSTDSNLDWEQ